MVVIVAIIILLFVPWGTFWFVILIIIAAWKYNNMKKEINDLKFKVRDTVKTTRKKVKVDRKI